MIKQLYKYFWLTPIFIFIQVYILNQVLFNGYINPYFYIMLIICLPQVTPRWFLLTFAFLLGISIDVFEGSIGFHSTACVMIAFLKPTIERIVIPKNIISAERDLFLQKLGFKIFAVYMFMLIFLHHGILFLLAHFEIATFTDILGKITLSSLITFVIIIVCQFFFFNSERRK